MHTPEEHGSLETECHSLCQYLVGERADPYVLNKYVQAHAIGSIGRADGDCDLVLAWTAARGPVLARFADSYASVFVRRGLLRRKLALLLAILETRFQPYCALDAPTTASGAALIARLCANAFATALGALVTAAALAPILAVRRFRARPWVHTH